MDMHTLSVIGWLSHDVQRGCGVKRYYDGSCSGKPGSHWPVDLGAGTTWAGHICFLHTRLEL